MAEQRRVDATRTQAFIPLKDGRVKVFNAAYSGQTVVGPDGRRFKPGMKTRAYYEKQIQKARRKLDNPATPGFQPIHASTYQGLVSSRAPIEVAMPPQYHRPATNGRRRRRAHLPAHEAYGPAYQAGQREQLQRFAANHRLQQDQPAINQWMQEQERAFY